MLTTTLPQHHSTIFIFLFLSSALILHVNPSTFIYDGCSPEKYQPNSLYETNLHTLLSSIANSAAQTLYNSFAVGNDSSAPINSAAYGLYQCRGDLKPMDCSTCIASAVSEINLVCPYTYGATLQLEGCSVRFENTDFLGRQDTSVTYRKCSKGVSSDAEFPRRRDTVLDDLQTVDRGFRVSSSGSVEGYAQCMGDLSEADCSSCLSSAASQLKSLCGSAEAGEVFLAQCYARYWAAGYYEVDSSDTRNEDDVGKTVAIIVGSVAGAAVLIVLISFCRKAYE